MPPIHKIRYSKLLSSIEEYLVRWSIFLMTKNYCTKTLNFGFWGTRHLFQTFTLLTNITRCTHLQSPSGIISRTLLAAENTSKLPSFPIPDGIPSKSNLLSSTWSLRKFCSLHNDAGSTVNLFRDKFKLSNFCQISIAKINIQLYYLLNCITKLIILWQLYYYIKLVIKIIQILLQNITY